MYTRIAERTPKAFKVVQLNEFSAFVRNYIPELTEEVEKDVEFYEEYIVRLENLVISAADLHELIERRGNLETEIGELIKTGKIVSDNNKLMEKSTDIEVAKSALRKEIASLQFFRFRKPYSLDIRCVELTLDTMNDKKPSIRQRALCAMQDHVKAESVCLFVDRVEVAVDLLPDNHSINVNGETIKPDTLDNTGTDGKDTDDQIVTVENKLVFNTIKCLNVENKYGYSRGCSHCETALIANNLYENKFFDTANRLHILIKGGLYVDVKTIDDIGFAANFFTKVIEKKCLDRCKYSKKRSLVNIVTSAGSSVLKYQTYLVNVFFAAPFSYNGNIINRSRIGDIETDQSRPIICLIGTRSLDSGIESKFLASDENNGPEFTNGIAVRAKVARFKQTDFSCTRGTSVSDIAVYKEPTGRYYLLKGMADSGMSLVTYSTNVGESDNAIVYHIPKDGPAIPISVDGFKAELLCEMKGGMFYVSRDEVNGAIAIGSLIMAGALITETIFTVTEADTPVQMDTLRPLTMAESIREELVIACAVDGDASKLAMIVPMKETVEILEIQFPDSEYNEGELVDMEMDSDGNIMCILKDIDGKMWRAITKYIMP